MRYVTVDGPLETDNVVAVAIAKKRFDGTVGERPIVRTHDPNVIRRGDIVVNFGGLIGTALPLAEGGTASFFDSCQKGGAGVRENGVPYAASGLLWKEYGPEIIEEGYALWKDKTRARRIHAIVDRDLIAGVDADACRYDLTTGWKSEDRPLTFATIISRVNSCEDFDNRFRWAVSHALSTLTIAIREAFAIVTEEPFIRTKIAARTDPRILTLDVPIPWQNTIAHSDSAGGLFYVVLPNIDSDKWSCGRIWHVECVPSKFGSFATRKKLPASWAGLRDVEFQTATGVQDALSCHPRGFTCSARSQQGAVRLAELACDWQD